MAEPDYDLLYADAIDGWSRMLAAGLRMGVPEFACWLMAVDAYRDADQPRLDRALTVIKEQTDVLRPGVLSEIAAQYPAGLHDEFLMDSIAALSERLYEVRT